MKRPAKILHESKALKAPATLKDVIGDIMKDVAPLVPRTDGLTHVELEELWNNVLPDWAGLTSVQSYRKGVLTITCKALPLIGELELMRPQLIKKLAEAGLSKIHEMKFKVGAPIQTPRAR